MVLKTRLFTIALVLSLCLPLAVSCQQAAPSPASDGGSSATFELAIDLLGKTHTLLLDSEGKLTARAELASADGTVCLTIAKGTRLLDKDRKPLAVLWAKIDSQPIALPEEDYVIGAVYNLGPSEAIFDPPLRLTLSYDSKELPEGVRESDVYIAPYDEGSGWGEWHYKNVDTKNDRVTAQITSLTRFAVLAPMPPPPSQPTTQQPSSATDRLFITFGEALANGKSTLAEFGSSSCIPCKQMKPILEELAREYKGKLNVVIVEVYEQMELTRYYRIMTIPTQIIFDSSGKELTRHMGFWSKEEIVAQLKKMGIE